MYPTGGCPDGVHQSGRGPCIRFAGGACGWTHLVCPASSGATCAPADCGLAAGASSWSCPDGVHHGAIECVVDDKGKCGVTHVPCAGVAQGTIPKPPPPPPPVATATTPASCDPLPPDAVLRTWDVGLICAPGGGPYPQKLKLVRDLGDGTFVFQGPNRCFRGKYQQCTSK